MEGWTVCGGRCLPDLEDDEEDDDFDDLAGSSTIAGGPLALTSALIGTANPPWKLRFSELLEDFLEPFLEPFLELFLELFELLLEELFEDCLRLYFCSNLLGPVTPPKPAFRSKSPAGTGGPLVGLAPALRGGTAALRLPSKDEEE